MCSFRLEFTQVSVIDMEKLLGADSIDTELKKLHQACKEWGFFQLVNHGVCNSLLKKLKTEIVGFFRLPLDEKKKYSQLEGDIQGYDRIFMVSDEQKLDWADMLYLVTRPIHLRKPHLLPHFPPSFRDVVLAYSEEVQSLSIKILKLMVKSLGVNPDELEVLLKEGLQGMRMNYYPPCPQPDQIVRLTPHSDANVIIFIGPQSPRH